EVENATPGVTRELPHIQESSSHGALEVLRGERIGGNCGSLLIGSNSTVSKLVERDEHRIATQTAGSDERRELFGDVDRRQYDRTVTHGAQPADHQSLLAKLGPLAQQRLRCRNMLKCEQLRSRVGANPAQIIEQARDLARRAGLLEPAARE